MSRKPPSSRFDKNKTQHILSEEISVFPPSGDDIIPYGQAVAPAVGVPNFPHRAELRQNVRGILVALSVKASACIYVCMIVFIYDEKNLCSRTHLCMVWLCVLGSEIKQNVQGIRRNNFNRGPAARNGIVIACESGGEYTEGKRNEAREEGGQCSW